MSARDLLTRIPKVADMLQKVKKPVVLAVNKVDSMAKFGNDVYEFYNLGIGDPVPVSRNVETRSPVSSLTR